VASGASKLIVQDLREEFLRDYVFPTMQAGAVYERDYLLGTSMARPLIAKKLVEVARPKTQMQSPTAAPAKATTRCASSSR